MTDDATAGVPSVAKEDFAGLPPVPGQGRSLRVVHRVVFPGADLDVVPLYVETNPERGAAELAAELLAESLGNRDPAPPAPTAATSRITRSTPRTTGNDCWLTGKWRPASLV